MIRPPVTRPSNSAGLPDNHDYAITAVVEESSGNPAYRGGTHWLNIMQEVTLQLLFGVYLTYLSSYQLSTRL